MTTGDADTLLLPYIQARDEKEAEEHLARLFQEHAEPRIRHILRNKLHASLDPGDGSYRNQDALEVINEINFRLVAELRAQRDGRRPEAIHDFCGYVAVVAFNTCSAYLRQKFPNRWRLRNKLHYFLSRQTGFALWKNDRQEWCCGLAGCDRGAATTQLQGEDWRENMRQAGLSQLPLGELLQTLFRQVRSPVALGDLVDAVAVLWGITEQADQGDGYEAATSKVSPNTTGKIDEVGDMLGCRQRLGQLWREICQLPRRHRAAILLNLRDEDGGGILALLPMLRVATIREIAVALEIPLKELVVIWPELPWDDARIARYLGLERQQVINLRYSARARLAGKVSD